MTFDIFNDDAFSLSSLTESLVNAEHKPTLLTDLGVFQAEPISTTTIQIEEENGALALIPFSDRGAPIAEGRGNKRKMRSFNTYRIAKGDTITSSEFQNVRPFGSESELLTAQKIVAKRNKKLIDEVDMTREYHRLAAVQGKLLDSDGSVVEDYFSAFSVSANANITILLTDTYTQIKTKLNVMIRSMVKEARGTWVNGRTGVAALCGHDFFDFITTHPELMKTYLNQSAANDIRNDGFATPYSTFKFGDVTFIDYYGTDDGTTVSVASDSAAVFPIGGNGIFVEYQAPSEAIQYVNTMGLPMYANIVRDLQRDFWVRPEVYAYGNTMCLRPKMLNTLKKG